ncbi:MAG: hypothetical protein JW716_01050 [Candidatus Aenigmarchaeota archaeon]|nr:hypothetical protein [Candidatus Aenigmarchaeota archaeon]
MRTAPYVDRVKLIETGGFFEPFFRYISKEAQDFKGVIARCSSERLMEALESSGTEHSPAIESGNGNFHLRIFGGKGLPEDSVYQQVEGYLHSSDLMDSRGSMPEDFFGKSVIHIIDPRIARDLPREHIGNYQKGVSECCRYNGFRDPYYLVTFSHSSI